LSASKDVNVTVYPYNQPPVVNAGADQTIIVPDPSLLISSGIMPTNPSAILSKSLLSVPHWNYAVGQPGLDAEIIRRSLSWSGTKLFAGGFFQHSGTNFIGQAGVWDGTNWAGLYDPSPLFPGGPPIGYNGSPNGIGPLGSRGDQMFTMGGFLKDLLNDGHGDFTARWDGAHWVPWQFQIVSFAVESGQVLATSNMVYLVGDWLSKPPTGLRALTMEADSPICPSMPALPLGTAPTGGRSAAI
jgi:hypothetical protein